MKADVLSARVRTETGSRACRKLRSQGWIPANLYGAKENVSLAVNAYEMVALINRHSSLLQVQFENRDELVQVVEVQRDTFGDDVLHVDLHMIDKDKKITGEVDFVFKGDAKGVKAGGSLMTRLKSLTVEALPANMPREILVRVDDLELNDGINIADLQLPEGVVAVGDPQQTVCLVVPPQEEVEEPEGLIEPGATEPEVISKGKQEEE